MAHRHSQVTKLAQEAVSDQTEATEAVNQIPQNCATFKVELLLDEDHNVRTTRVTYDQDKTKEDHWDGWIEPKLLNFFVRSAGLHRPLPGPGSSPEPMSPHASPVSSEAVTPPVLATEGVTPEALSHSKVKGGLSGRLAVSGITTMPVSSDVPRSMAPANEAFRVRLLLDLSEVRTSPSRALHCAVTIWARNLETGARQIVGEGRSKFMPIDQVPCTLECKIPSEGAYRLEALVTVMPASTIHSRSTVMAWLESGLLVIY